MAEFSPTTARDSSLIFEGSYTGQAKPAAFAVPTASASTAWRYRGRAALDAPQRAPGVRPAAAPGCALEATDSG